MGVKSLPRHTECAYYFLEVLAMMKFRHLWMLIPAAALLMAIVSCGGADKSEAEKAAVGDNSPPPAEADDTSPPPSGEADVNDPSIVARMAALDEIDKKTQTLPGKDIDGDNEALAAWLKARPDIEAAGISADRTVWAVFTDGRSISFLRSRDAKGRPVLGSPGAGPRPRDKAALGLVQDDPKGKFMMPASRHVRVLTFTGFVGDKVRQEYLLPVQVIKWFEAAGYSVTQEFATIPAYQRVKDDGVLFIQTHGGFDYPIIGGDITAVPNLVSSTRVDPKHEALYKADLDAHRIGYGHVTDDGGGNRLWYDINPSFVRHYMALGDNAFVFLNACNSFANNHLRDAFFAKGASTFAGWSRETDFFSAFRASTFLFDRLLAGNQYVPESPKQRPFYFGAVYGDMRQRNYDTNLDPLAFAEEPPVGRVVDELPQVPAPTSKDKRPTGTALLLIDHKSGHVFTGLRPSIWYMSVFETLEELHLLGYFGAKQGTVKIDGHAVSVKKWAADGIVVALPSSGPGSAGPVVVEVDGRPSNAVPLTEWHIKFRYTSEDNTEGPTLKKTATITLHLRADVHAYRSVPHEEPHANGNKGRPFSSTGLLPARDSKVEWAFSGKATNKQKTTYELTGAGAFTLAEAKKDGPIFSFSGRLDVEDKTVDRVSLNAFAGRYGTVKITNDQGKTSEEIAGLIGAGAPDIDTLKLDAKLTIKSGKVDLSRGKITAKLEWDDIPAKHLPEADTLAAAPQPNWQFAEAARVTQLDGLPVGTPRRLAERGQGR